ncbi:MAG: glycosyltransferase family 1 protein [Candidatus Melainabacteria bacterium]|jgi:glycosyltransferase involved in cell wall biosynthesis|nr:MAG: glycosyltransferase family 1 protein [Candidatus Melainabacteria bacterium]
MTPQPKDLSQFPVLLWIPGSLQIFGGHTIQFERTATYLRALGWDVTVDFTPEVDLSRFKVVQGLGLTPRQITECKTRGAAVLLSTVYWSVEYGYPTYRTSDWLRQKLGRSKLAIKTGLQIIRGTGSAAGLKLAQQAYSQKARYDVADILLPNSQLEKECIIRELGTTTPQMIVPNSADRNIFRITEPWQNRKNSVAYCGRIEPHKNQLNLIRAAKSINVPLTIVGPSHPHHQHYYDTCVREAQGADIKFLALQKQEDLVALYNSVKVHAVPSWFETTGLVSLESALCGCGVVSTNQGFAREYLGDHVEYCHPNDIQGIARAIQAAFQRPPNQEFINHIKEDFCWERTAEATSNAYLAALNQ